MIDVGKKPPPAVLPLNRPRSFRLPAMILFVIAISVAAAGMIFFVSRGSNTHSDENPSQQRARLQTETGDDGALRYRMDAVPQPTYHLSSETSWATGGNLHDSTLAEWYVATPRNKLATCADWLLATVWSDEPLDSNLMKNTLKVKAQSLSDGIDVVADSNPTSSYLSKVYAAFWITAIADLAP